MAILITLADYMIIELKLWCYDLFRKMDGAKQILGYIIFENKIVIFLITFSFKPHNSEKTS